jgi:SAM-dependent methyltransferase
MAAPIAAFTCSACGTTFPADEGIVRLGQPGSAADDYPEALYDLVAAVESRHFWFAARNAIILRAIRRTLGPLSGQRLLDVGCGTGFVLRALEQAGADAWGIDMHVAALRHARRKVGGTLVWSPAERLPFLDDFDVVSLFDVIEHATDDVGLLKEARRVLRPGGSVIVTVPAGPQLWTAYDDVIGHKRRYTRAQLRAVLSASGLSPLTVDYFNCVPAWLQRLHRLTATHPEPTDGPVAVVERTLAVPPRPINVALRYLLPLEAPLGRLPFVTGASLLAVAQRD